MKHFAKWTFLLVMAGLVGFSATVLATQSTHLARLLSQDTRNLESAVLESAAPEAAMQPEAGLAAAVDNADTSGSPAIEIAAVEDERNGSSAAELTLAADDQTQAAQPQTGAASGAGLGTAIAQADTAPPVIDEQAPQSQVTGGMLSAVGTVEVAHGRQVVLGTSGQVKEIAVEVGDQVQAGELLVGLDTTFLDWSLEQAEINFETARINFEELGETVLESDVAVAEANLLLAQENLALARQGPTEETMAAAQAAAEAAWANYEELQQQPTQAQINQALANLRRAEINVEAAQREYDRIAWLPEASATAAADALQSATIDLEAAQAAFDEVNRPATESQLKGALSSAQSAQATLNDLRRLPTAAEIASAEAALASAEAAYEQARLGPRESEMRIGELSVRQAMINLEEARLALDNAQVVAPIDGTILSVDVELGQQASAGSVVATLADPLDVRLVVNVEQRDIRFVSIGQGVEISIYALPDVTFLGVVDKIAPIAGTGTGFVTFPVIIELVDGPVERVLPGMTASANFLGDISEEEAVEEEAANDVDDAAEVDEPVDAADDQADDADQADEAEVTDEAEDEDTDAQELDDEVGDEETEDAEDMAGEDEDEE